jgi:hypothetical protein
MPLGDGSGEGNRGFDAAGKVLMQAAMGWGEYVRVEMLGNPVDGPALSTVGMVASQKRLKGGHEREPMNLRLGWPPPTLPYSHLRKIV